jgi:hypothetical protein
MCRQKKDPLRALMVEERASLERVSRSLIAPAGQVTWAKQLLAVADGASYLAAAHATGRRSNDAVSHLVSRFNREGLAALELRHGGHPPIVYGPAERERILIEFQRPPDRARAPRRGP